MELVNNDYPVACSIYTRRIFDVILNILRDKCCSPYTNTRTRTHLVHQYSQPPLTNATNGDHRFHHKNENVDKNMIDEFKRLDNHRLDTVSQRYLRAIREDIDPETEFTIALLKTAGPSTHTPETSNVIPC